MPQRRKPSAPPSIESHVALYRRISTDETRQPWSLDAQKASLEAHCKARGLTIVADYVDEASGATLDRPGLMQALADAKTGLFSQIVFYRMDRFSRNLRQLLQMIDELEAHHVDISSVMEQLDTKTPIGRTVVSILGAFAQLERELIRDRITEGIRSRMRSGLWVGNLPVGLKLVDGVPIADMDWLPVAARVYRMYCDDRLGTVKIARTLNNEGTRTPTGSMWTPAAVGTLLKSAAYIGAVRYGGEIIDGAFDPVIDRGLWTRAQALLAERSSNPRLLRGNESSYLLSSTTRCRRCGSAYVGAAGNGRGGRYTYYRCQGRIKYGKEFCDNDSIQSAALEDAVIEELVGLLSDTDLLEKAFDRAKKAAVKGGATARSERGRIERQLRDLRARREAYYDAFERRVLEPESFKSRLNQLDEQESALLQEQARLTSQGIGAAAEFPADAIRMTKELLANIRETNPEQAKALIRLLVQEVSIGGRDDVSCTYRLPTERAADAVRATNGEVELGGLEPPTSWVRSRRSPS